MAKAERSLLTSMLKKTKLVLFDRSNNTVPIDVEMDESALEEKASFVILCCLQENWSFDSFLSMKFLSPEVALYLYKSVMRPCMEYCCHVWAGATSCYLKCEISCKNGYVLLLVLHCLPLLNL